MRQKLAAGNWKMNGLSDALAELRALDAMLGDQAAEVLICPPSTLISRAANSVAHVAIGGQDCHTETAGAHTGDISAAMVADAGASHVILGHSERRQDYGESDALVRDKTNAAWDAGLTAIVCVGETLEDREASNTLDIIGGQLAGSIPDLATGQNLVVAYEPVWAIGTGLTPSLVQIGEVHDFIRIQLVKRYGEGTGRSIRILYGGSIKPSNAAEICAVSNVDGGLVGGASLKAEDFGAIVKAMG